MTVEEQIVSRYQAWLLSGVYPTIYYASEKSWKEEIESKIKEISKKLKSKINE